MQLDFEYEGTRYMLNFECVDCEKNENGNSVFEMRVYYSLEADSPYASSLKMIKDNKIVWGQWDDMYVPKSAQLYCDRMVNLMVYA
jgi:hypothetical protein